MTLTRHTALAKPQCAICHGVGITRREVICPCVANKVVRLVKERLDAPVSGNPDEIELRANLAWLLKRYRQNLKIARVILKEE